MDTYSHAEQEMWKEPLPSQVDKMDPSEINTKYDTRVQRIVTETNREKLPNFIQALERPGYIDLHPFYQRRIRWDDQRQSRLIESFIINVPVPPIFLYERSYNSYEVMDGQQRITAIRRFYENELKLCGLEVWPELDGMYYRNLPSRIKDGIDRRSISSIVLLKESTPEDEDATLLRQLVFERLNTGGIKLEKQEIRNALYRGKLNELLERLSRYTTFRRAWKLPLYDNDESPQTKPRLYENNFYRKMADHEVILRFFALRHTEHYHRSLQYFLDVYSIRSKSFTEEDIVFLEKLYKTTIDLAYSVYSDKIFRPYIPLKNEWASQPQRTYHDAVMVGFSRLIDKSKQIIQRRDVILNETKSLFTSSETSTFTGRKSTKKDVVDRIDLFTAMLRKSLF